MPLSTVTLTASVVAKGPMMLDPKPAAWPMGEPPFTLYSIVAEPPEPRLVRFTSTLNWLLGQLSTTLAVAVAACWQPVTSRVNAPLAVPVPVT